MPDDHLRGKNSMPYTTTDQLPLPVRKHLPGHAKEIYLAAFNNAWEQYGDPGRRRGEESREEAAHRVAWAAVKQKYRKDDATGRWVEKTD